MIPREPKEAKYIHPLARFVTVEAIALLLKVDIIQIKTIRCWARVVLVVGKGLSKFVSYADLPPILTEKAPNNADIIWWRKRWRKNNQQAPQFWLEFYLHDWGQIVGGIKFGLSPVTLQQLRNFYSVGKAKLENISLMAAIAK